MIYTAAPHVQYTDSLERIRGKCSFCFCWVFCQAKSCTHVSNPYAINFNSPEAWRYITAHNKHTKTHTSRVCTDISSVEVKGLPRLPLQTWLGFSKMRLTILHPSLPPISPSFLSHPSIQKVNQYKLHSSVMPVCSPLSGRRHIN